MHAVDDECLDDLAGLGQALREEGRLLHGVTPGRGDEHERGIRIAEEVADDPRSVPEALFHTLEGAEERDDVLDHLGADDAGDGAQERLYRNARDPQVGTRRHHEQAEHAIVEQTYESLGRVEEVERVASGRRVDDDQIEVALVVQLVQLLHRHVLLGATERTGDVAIEAVVEDPLRLLG